MLEQPIPHASQRRLGALLALCLAAALNACGGGQGAPSADTPTTPLPDQIPAAGGNSLAAVVSTLSCEADAHITSPQSPTLFNNTWNVAAAGTQSWQQCLQSRAWAGNSAVQYGWRWSWPDAGGALFAYPSVIVGAKPWESGPGNDARFPLRLADAKTLSLRFAAETSTSAASSRNLAASVWLISTPKVAAPPDQAAIQAEVMVWTDYTDDMVADPGTTTLQGEFTDAQGIGWDILADKNWGDASSSTNHRWTYVAFHIKAGQRRTAAQIDLLAMLKHAASLGLFSTSLYIADVELGNELVAGQGETWLTDFSVMAN
jgi:hypothetical protein